MNELQKIREKIRKDEYGLYIHASNYIDCKAGILTAEAIRKLQDDSTS